MKYDSSTGKMYEELGCTSNNAAASGSTAMDTLTPTQPSTSSSTPSSSGMTQSQQMHSDYYQNYQHAYPYSSQMTSHVQQYVGGFGAASHGGYGSSCSVSTPSSHHLTSYDR